MTGDSMLLLKTELDAGHAGPSGRFERLKEIAFEYAFLLKSIGEGQAASSKLEPIDTRTAIQQ